MAKTIFKIIKKQHDKHYFVSDISVRLLNRIARRGTLKIILDLVFKSIRKTTLFTPPDKENTHIFAHSIQNHIQLGKEIGSF